MSGCLVAVGVWLSGCLVVGSRLDDWLLVGSWLDGYCGRVRTQVVGYHFGFGG